MPARAAIPHTSPAPVSAELITRALEEGGVLTVPQVAAVTGLRVELVHTVAARLVERGQARRVARGVYARACAREPARSDLDHAALDWGVGRVLQRAGVRFALTGWTACGVGWQPAAWIAYVPPGAAVRAAVALARSSYTPLVNPSRLVLTTAVRYCASPQDLVVIRERSLKDRRVPVTDPGQAIVDLLAERRRGFPVDQDDLALALWRLSQAADPQWRGLLRHARRRGIPLILSPAGDPPLAVAANADEAEAAFLTETLARATDPFADLLAGEPDG